METWLKYPENKPKHMKMCVVVNNKHGFHTFIAIYHPDSDVFVLLDFNYRPTVCLNVTHFIEIPEIHRQ